MKGEYLTYENVTIIAGNKVIPFKEINLSLNLKNPMTINFRVIVDRIEKDGDMLKIYLKNDNLSK